MSRNQSRRRPMFWRRKKKGRSESKSSSVSRWLSPASQNITQTIMLQGESSLSSSGTGTSYSSIPFDPSASGYSFAEWSNVAALWTEIKHVFTVIQIVRANGASITSGSPLFVGYRFDTNAAPTSIGQVTQLASAKIWDIQNDTSPYGFSMTARARGPLNWSPTSTVVVNTYAGCPGCIQLAGLSFPNSIGLGFIRVRSVYMIRGRA